MDINAKLAVLDRLYQIYDGFTHKLDVACQRYCADCCTCNVTMTTLEGYKVVESLISNGNADLLRHLGSSPSKRFQPRTTTNQLAELCVAGRDLPDEENDSKWGSCPFLIENNCPLYLVRPFGCRCFASKHKCGSTGYADIEPMVVSVNNVFLQYIEHIDSQGGSGNLTDVLRFLESPDNRERYRTNRLDRPGRELVPNRPIKALLIPPEHRAEIAPLLQEIQNIKVPCE